MDENKSCISCSYLEKERGQWYACSLHKEYIEDDSQAETCPDFRIAELEGLVDKLIEAGDEMSDQSYWNENKWLALVKDWKERKE